jgi:hypothetical protein
VFRSGHGTRLVQIFFGDIDVCIKFEMLKVKIPIIFIYIYF